FADSQTRKAYKKISLLLDPSFLDLCLIHVGEVTVVGAKGNLGRFINNCRLTEKSNASLARQLAELMQEANQEVPDWLTRYASRASFGGGKKRIIYCCGCLKLEESDEDLGRHIHNDDKDVFRKMIRVCEPDADTQTR
ncbi:unnamed protein product, partial [Brassica rapa subsp. trilocularis]